MKAPIKIVEFRDGTYGAKRKGWFGWKYFNYVEDEFGTLNHTWTYSLPTRPAAKFPAPKHCIDVLKMLYHSNRVYRERREL